MTNPRDDGEAVVNHAEAKELAEYKKENSNLARWRMPPNTVSVTRPGKWGNPFTVAEYGRLGAVAKYREMIEGRGLLLLRRELRGKNLACYCRLDDACHADVLLELANAP